LTARGALEAHARDELGIHETARARPVQAALTSAAMFAGGGIAPLMVAAFTPAAWLAPTIAGSSLVFLAALGAAGAKAGGAGAWKGAVRVTFWGALAMAVTAGIGRLVGTVV
jgi:VIT1/CCC1 family predicted Fe2+/Mn2+ transporter